jgi:hypothetical protein
MIVPIGGFLDFVRSVEKLKAIALTNWAAALNEISE